MGINARTGLTHDLGKSKMKQAKKLNADIAQGNADAIAGGMTHDLGKQKLAQAQKMNGEIAASNVDAIAGGMAKDMVRILPHPRSSAISFVQIFHHAPSSTTGESQIGGSEPPRRGGRGWQRRCDCGRDGERHGEDYEDCSHSPTTRTCFLPYHSPKIHR
jgi:hypothetical protein